MHSVQQSHIPSYHTPTSHLEDANNVLSSSKMQIKKVILIALPILLTLISAAVKTFLALN